MKNKRQLKRNNVFQDAQYLNTDTYLDFLNRLKKLALCMFEWTNLPDSMNSRYLERCLYYEGQAALLFDKKYGFINTRACDSGYINIYGLPTVINCYSYDYQSTRKTYMGFNEKTKKEFEAILVMNTFERLPTAGTLELYAQRLAEAQRTCDINIKAQRTPILITTDQKQQLTLKNVYEQYDGNSPVITVDKNGFTPEALKSINTEAPYIADKVKEYMTQIWNEALTYLGVNNLAEKKERLIQSEANSNNEVINLNLESYLAPRKEACKQFNDKFGLTGDKAIDVKVRSDLHNLVKEMDNAFREDFETVTTDLGEGV